MADEQVPLEEWVMKTSGSVGSREKKVLARFQKDWEKGGQGNPLLFPFYQSQDEWEEQYEWYLTTERFSLPEAQTVKQPRLEPQKSPQPSAPAQGEAETVIYDPSAELSPPATGEDHQATVIYDPTADSPQAEAGADHHETVIYDPTADSPQADPGADHHETIVIDRLYEGPEDDELVDLGALPLASPPESGPQPEEDHDETVIFSPEAEPVQVERPPKDAGAVESGEEPDFGDELSDLGTLTIEAGLGPLDLPPLDDKPSAEPVEIPSEIPPFEFEGTAVIDHSEEADYREKPTDRAGATSSPAEEDLPPFELDGGAVIGHSEEPDYGDELSDLGTLTIEAGLGPLDLPPLDDKPPAEPVEIPDDHPPFELEGGAVIDHSQEPDFGDEFPDLAELTGEMEAAQPPSAPADRPPQTPLPENQPEYEQTAFFDVDEDPDFADEFGDAPEPAPGAGGLDQMGDDLEGTAIIDYSGQDDDEAEADHIARLSQLEKGPSPSTSRVDDSPDVEATALITDDDEDDPDDSARPPRDEGRKLAAEKKPAAQAPRPAGADPKKPDELDLDLDDLDTMEWLDE